MGGRESSRALATDPMRRVKKSGGSRASGRVGIEHVGVAMCAMCACRGRAVCTGRACVLFVVVPGVSESVI